MYSEHFLRFSDSMNDIFFSLSITFLP